MQAHDALITPLQMHLILLALSHYADEPGLDEESRGRRLHLLRQLTAMQEAAGPDCPAFLLGPEFGAVPVE